MEVRISCKLIGVLAGMEASADRRAQSAERQPGRCHDRLMQPKQNSLHHPVTALKTLTVAAWIATLASCSPPPAANRSGEAKKSPSVLAAKPPEKSGPTFATPEHVRGIYLTAWSAGSPKKVTKLIAMMNRTGLNAVVIDVRDLGEMYWNTGIELSRQAKADMHAIPNSKKLFAVLAEHHIYPIARIACFRDNYVPVAFPDRAVQTQNGKVWRDRSGHSWLDPYNKKNWDYIAQVVDYALAQGFPEIQLDYVRFPSEGKSSSQMFPGAKSYPDPKALHEDVISAFAKFIGDKVHAAHAMFSADIFGIISAVRNDQGIGQELEKIAAPFDVISPMLYASHFANGEYGIKDPNRAPYDIVLKSLRDYQRRLANAKVRPWLQAFTLKGVHYGDAQVLDQIRAARDCGYQDYLLWNAANRYDFAVSLVPVSAAAGTPASKK